MNYVITANNQLTRQQVGYIKLTFHLFDTTGKMEIVNLPDASFYSIKPGSSLTELTRSLSAKMLHCIPYFATENIVFQLELIQTMELAKLDYKEVE